MKKSLLALAALSAIAGTAQAQSSVTLFGAIDAGAYYVNGVAKSSDAAFGVLGNTIVSSNWGLKGTEDLGGGLKANFYAESGINPRNGTLSQAGQEVSAPTVSPTVTLFDRGLYAGLQGNWGAINVGNKLNPFYASAAGLVPVAGNSVTTNAAQAGNYFLPFVHNSISYQLPTMSGFNAALQYGAGNAINNSSSGSVTAGSLSYTTGGLTLTAAGQYLAKGGTQVSANNIGAAYSNPTVVSAAAAAGGTAAAYEAGLTSAATSPSIGTYLVGAKYNAGAFTIGGGFVANQVGAYTGSFTTTVNGTTAVKNGYRAYSLNQYQLGVGYQATPAVLLGLSWVGATSGSNLINAQARYAFSKRTQAYAQVGYVVNNKGLALNAYNAGNMTALAGSGGASFNGTNTAVPATTWNQLGLGVGLIHTF